MYTTLGLVLVLVSCCAADTCDETCDFNNEQCLMKGATVMFKSAVEGFDGELPSIDPMLIPIVKDIPDLESVVVKGLRGCHVTKIRLDTSVESFDYGLHCPAVVSKFNDLNAGVTSIAYDCDLSFTGDYGIYYKGALQKKHLFIKRLNSTRAACNDFSSVELVLDGGEPLGLQKDAIRSMTSTVGQQAMRVLINYHKAYLDRYCSLDVFPAC